MGINYTIERDTLLNASDSFNKQIVILSEQHTLQLSGST